MLKSLNKITKKKEKKRQNNEDLVKKCVKNRKWRIMIREKKEKQNIIRKDTENMIKQKINTQNKYVP